MVSEIHSPIHALTDITEKVRNGLDSKYNAYSVFIDLKKALDTVNHTILLDKLKHYGVRGITKNWFKSFLQDRYQYTNIKECRPTQSNNAMFCTSFCIRYKSPPYRQIT